MKIGIVLSKTPSYSETFFNSKIKGLKESGFGVLLFVQQVEKDFDLCEVRVAPKIYRRNPIKQLISILEVSWVVITHFTIIHRFINLERAINRSWSQITKNIYNNSHLLTSNLDWVHFGFATMALQSENVAQAIDAKMGVSLRGFDMDVYPLKHNNPYTLLWKKVDKVHAISNYMLQRAYDEGLSRDKDYLIITPAIDITKFDFNKNSYQEQNNFLTIGRLHWIKGLNYTLEALAELKKMGYKFHYTIVGTGSEKDELVYSIHQSNLEDSVTLTGRKTHAETIEYLYNTSIYLQYSISEGFCNAVLEAQATGCLCIVSDGGALPENVLHNETGIVVTKRNPKALAEAIIKAIDLSEDKKNAILLAARQRIESDFSIKQQNEEFRKFYRG